MHQLLCFAAEDAIWNSFNDEGAGNWNSYLRKLVARDTLVRKNGVAPSPANVSGIEPSQVPPPPPQQIWSEQDIVSYIFASPSRPLLSKEIIAKLQQLDTNIRTELGIVDAGEPMNYRNFCNPEPPVSCRNAKRQNPWLWSVDGLSDVSWHSQYLRFNYPVYKVLLCFLQAAYSSPVFF